MARLALLVCLFAITSVAMAQLAGGVTEQEDVSNPVYLEKAWGAAKKVNEGSNNGQFHYIPIKVLFAKSQVVAGSLYTFEVLFGESNCARGTVGADQLTKEACQLKQGGARAIYKIKLWEKVWENFQEYNVERVRVVQPSEQF